ncbi:hypothetical protein GGTG_03135 [Gaeumannomyces tritici R3-111a-1]|uniref:Glycosyl transferase family 1 domain-containing protein n=1 Tax=Gaeumannomyces tritici (strain R3-111a-1) TaxID=644352 RepID=J3NPC7_GAET3|nr:hypothetical protein GGTG_03135 [Gaeumannomyces tritici R3-111a-1]EJT78032.1 hypothetical protein GGTG_03135 [Gaeumannomyces tritici R3-111a-1]
MNSLTVNSRVAFGTGLTNIAMDISQFPESLRDKRILLCTESFGPVNGVSRTTLMLVNHLRENGVDVRVVAPYNHTKHNTFVPAVRSQQRISPSDATLSHRSPLLPLDQRNTEFRVKGYPLPYNPELSVAYPVRLSTVYAQTCADGRPPDLVYLASPASLGFQVMLQMRQQRAGRQVPIVANFQTALGEYCAILLPGPLGRQAAAVFAAVEGFLYRHASVRAVFYPSSYVRHYLEGRAAVGSPGKLHLLRRGVDTELFNPAKHSDALRRRLAPGGEAIVLCVTRIAGEKGLDFLAAVAAELDARGRDGGGGGVPFVLHVVGGNRSRDVLEGVRASFPARLLDKGRVVFAGFQAGEELARSYATADVFAHCSVTETFGLVVLESMASGVPVVARDAGGPSDVVRHGETGFLVPPPDVRGFADKIVLLARDADRRRRFGEAARRQACDATWDRINNAVAWKMAEVIEEKRAEQLAAAAGCSGVGRFVRPWIDYLGDKARYPRLAVAMGFIFAIWAAVGFYLAFIIVTLWARSQLRL